MSEFPQAPWTLEGEGYQLVSLVPVDAARRLVPAGLEVVSVLPEWTAGGVWLASYSGDSTLCYSEMIVFSAVVRASSFVGAWVESIYVDSPESAAGGRAIWGLPKQLARFAWTPGGVTVSQAEQALCRVDGMRHVPSAWTSLPVPLLAPAVSLLDGRPQFFQGCGSSLVTPSRATWFASPRSTMSSLGLTGRRCTLHHRHLRLTVPAPVAVG